MMIIAATQAFHPAASPANAHPSNTATTGFTHANVETGEGQETVSNQVKIVKAIIDPNRIK